MPTYEVELSDGRVVELEGERQPTEAEVYSLIGAQDQDRESKKQQYRAAADVLRKERGRGNILESLASGAASAIEPLTPAGLLNQPARIAKAITGDQYQDPFAAGRPIAPVPEPEGTGVVAGLGKLGARLANALQTPESAVTLPALPISRTVQALTAGQLLSELPASAQQAYQTVQNPEASTAEKIAAVGAPVVQGAAGALLMRGPSARPSGLGAGDITDVAKDWPPIPKSPLMLQRGAIPMGDVPPKLTPAQTLEQLRQVPILEQEAELNRLQGQKRPAQAAPAIIGEQAPTEPQVIPAPSASIINLARRAVMKSQFDQLQRDFESAQNAGDGQAMGAIQKQMLDLQRQLHPVELEREQLSTKFEGEGTWPPTSEQIGTFKTKGRPGVISQVTRGGEPSSEALPSAAQPPSTRLSREPQLGTTVYGEPVGTQPADLPTRERVQPTEPAPVTESEVASEMGFLSPRGPLSSAIRREAIQRVQARHAAEAEQARARAALGQAAESAQQPGKGQPYQEPAPTIDLRQLEAKMKKGQIKPGIISGTAAERWASEVLSGKQLHGGIPVDVPVALAIKGAAMIERGIRNFAEWSAEMLKEYGDEIKPQLRNLYNQSVQLWQHSLDQPKEKGTADAIKEGKVKESGVGEHTGTSAQRVSPETGGGNRPVTETPVQTQVGKFRPAIRLVGGGVAEGKLGQVHNDVISDHKLTTKDIDQRGFVDENGQWHDRETVAASVPGIKTNIEPGRAHASEVAEAQSKGPKNVLEKARDTLKSLWQTKDVREAMTYKRDVADNAAQLFGKKAANDVRGELRRTMGRSKVTPLDEESLSFVIESGRDANRLQAFKEQIQGSEKANPKWKSKAIAAIEHAQKNLPKLSAIAKQYNDFTDTQVATENANGINTIKRNNYVMHAQEVPDEWGFLSSGEGTGGAGFKHARTHDTFADSISDGVDPKTLNAVDLLQSRLSRGQSLVNNRQWVDSLRTTVDPKTSNPIVTDPIVIQRGEGLPADHRAPNGYHTEMAGGRPIAVLDGYGGIFDALTSPSKIMRYAPTQALLRTAVVGKSIALMVDTFHLARVAFWESIIKPLSFTDPKAPIPSYRKGVLLLDYSPEEITRMGKSGDLPKGTVEKVLAAKKDVDGLVRNGYNVGRIADALHQEWIQAVPALGKVNKFIFQQFQRGAMAEVGVLEAGRYRRMHPSWTEDQVYREVAKDLNTRFGQLGRQGLIRSKTNQDLARLIALAPQWNEGLIRSEAGALTGAVKGVASSIKEGKPSFGVLPRAIGAMMVSQFAANQLINYITRGKPTWDNPEEGFGAKVSAWIPDVVGGGPGFFLHPFGLAAEVSHLFEMKMEKNPNLRDALLAFGGSRLSTLSRPVFTYTTGKSPIGNKPIRPEDINKETIKSAVPLPIGGSAIGQAAKQVVTGEKQEQFAGQYQKQLMSSFGVKTDQAPSHEQRIVQLAKKFNESKGYKANAEFYSSDFAPLTDALRRGAMKEAAKTYSDLQKKKTPAQIVKHFSSQPFHPFTRSRMAEAEFVSTLSPEQRQTYEDAQKDRLSVSEKFFRMLGSQP